MILFPAIDLKGGQCVRLKQGDMDRATVFNVAKHARILELGGTIKPLTKKYLTIPVNRRAELLRERNPDLSVSKGTVFQSKAGNLILVIREGKGDTKGGGDAVFVLKPRVTIAARPWFRPVFARSRDKMLGAMRGAMKKHINAAASAAISGVGSSFVMSVRRPRTGFREIRSGIGQLLPQTRETFEDVAPRRVLAGLHHVGDLAVREIPAVTQRHRETLLLRQTSDASPEDAVARRVGGAVNGSSGHGCFG